MRLNKADKYGDSGTAVQSVKSLLRHSKLVLAGCRLCDCILLQGDGRLRQVPDARRESGMHFGVQEISVATEELRVEYANLHGMA